MPADTVEIPVDLRIRREWLLKVAVQIAELLLPFAPDAALNLLNRVGGWVVAEHRIDNGPWKRTGRVTFRRMTGYDGQDYEFLVEVG